MRNNVKRILLDENLPIKLATAAPPNCHVGHVLQVGWAHMLDGELLAERTWLVTMFF